MAKSVDLVIFDMDGLLFDTEILYLNKWFVAAERFGVKITKDQVIKSMGASREVMEKYFHELFGAEFLFQDAIKAISDLIVEDVEKNGLKIKKGFPELYTFLKKRGIKTALATSTGQARTELYLQKSGLTDAFDLVLCGESVSHGKPAPDIFLKAARALGAAPDRCMVLEDSANGILAASRAGMIPVCIPDLKQPSDEIRSKCYKVLSSLDCVVGEIL
ncbi:MAG: HAD family hydrolase [Eubacteriales bacterium]